MLSNRIAARGNTTDLSPSTKSSLNDLDRLLSRLTKAVLSDDADPELRHSVFYRRKTGVNVEYARTLLLRLEQDVSAAGNAIKATSQRQAIIADLAAKRETVKQLNRTLIELDQLDVDDGPDASSQISGNIFDDSKPIATQTAEADRLDHARAQVGHTTDGTPTEQQQQPPTSPLPSTSPAIRSRKLGASATTNPSATTSSSQPSTSLFSSRSTEKAPSTALQSREETLAASEKEQEAIKASLLTLATQLKASNLSFAQSLEEEKSVLDAAVKGLDKNAMGLEGAERRMGTLRKMTEGQGMYGRLKLYAVIAALWVAAFLLVFVGPKLRF